ncbi:hypothetical protein LTR41_010934 [Exophiala xenobiotica]|nr:hypothetical protein LTR41_010934 [Exophiala xenobiotica]KAK5551101.1 hypothetical protein LTR46_010854 [Exophiala xenobiotica]
MTTNAAKVARREAIIDYQFQDKLKCLEALQASGHTLHGVAKSSLSAKTTIWQSSGMLSPRQACAEGGTIVAEAKALLVNTNLIAVGYGYGLHDCVILNQGTLSASDKTMARTVEAILVAVSIDGGADVLRAVLVTLGLTHQFLEPVMSYSCLVYNTLSILLSTLSEVLDRV